MGWFTNLQEWSKANWAAVTVIVLLVRLGKLLEDIRDLLRRGNCPAGEYWPLEKVKKAVKGER